MKNKIYNSRMITKGNVCNMTKVINKLIDFINESPTSFHAVETMAKRFQKEGFTELKESEYWELQPNGKYYVIRNHSALIAFVIPEEKELKNVWSYHIMASHSDSPTFKLKENSEISVENSYVKLNIEKYGGMIMSTWFDRPLSVAGRLLIEKEDDIQEVLVNVDRDFVMIPSLAIHMNREVNDGYSFNAQKDMLPLYGGYDAKGTFMSRVAEEAGVNTNEILSHDLFLYSRTAPSVWGADNEFISCGRIDDLECAFVSMEGFLAGEKRKSIALHCVLDNEEVGSGTKQGAASTFLQDVLMRINSGLGRSYEEYLIMLAKSFMISADNGHALHPNYPDKCDPVNRPVLNGGVMIKYSANQKYCTDGVSAAEFKKLCKKADVPYQIFVNRSDILGGSTLGNIANTQVAVSTVDIGLPQLAMHSAYETAGVKDVEYLCKVAKEFFA